MSARSSLNQGHTGGHRPPLQPLLAQRLDWNGTVPDCGGRSFGYEIVADVINTRRTTYGELFFAFISPEAAQWVGCGRNRPKLRVTGGSRHVDRAYGVRAGARQDHR